MKSSFEMNHIKMVCVLPVVLLLGISCSTKEMAYISNAERDSVQCILRTYSSIIHPGDELYISVISQTQEAAEPFNLTTHSLSISQSVENTDSWFGPSTISETYKTYNIGDLGGYLVTEEGTISFPIIGKVRAAGLTQDSLANRIAELLVAKGYLNDPIVTVSPLNFRVSVVGEVNIPKELHITGNRLTIFEALAMCGDITIYGQRDHVKVVRDMNGGSKVIEVDLTQKALFDSDAYYLQSNDIVYVEPNKVKKRESNRDENSMQYITFWVAVGGMVANLFRAYIMS